MKLTLPKNDEVIRSKDNITETFLPSLKELYSYTVVDLPNAQPLIDYIEQNGDIDLNLFYDTMNRLDQAMKDSILTDEIRDDYNRMLNSIYYFYCFGQYSNSGDDLDRLIELVLTVGKVEVKNLEPFHPTEIILRDAAGNELDRKEAVKGKIVFDNLPSGLQVYLDSDYHYIHDLFRKFIFKIP